VLNSNSMAEKSESVPTVEDVKTTKTVEKKVESGKKLEDKKQAIKQSTEEETKSIIKSVAGKATEWSKLSVDKKLAFLAAIRQKLAIEIDAWISEGAKQHGYELGNPKHAHLVAEVYAKGPAMLGAWLNTLENTYNSILQTGLAPRPLASKKVSPTRWSSQVFPWGFKETVFATGSTVHVYTEGEEIKHFNPIKLAAGVTGVLGAGNFDCPNDVLHSLFLENKVVIHKANPVVARSSLVIQRILNPLVEAGYLGFVYGGPEVGKLLIESPEVNSLMMTGSCRTYDAIVWEGKEKKRKESDQTI